VKEEVHRQATKINSTHRTDVSTLRKLLTWIRPAREQPDVDVARDLVRVLPTRNRRRYWTILRGLVRNGTYPVATMPLDEMRFQNDPIRSKY